MYIDAELKSIEFSAFFLSRLVLTIERFGEDPNSLILKFESASIPKEFKSMLIEETVPFVLLIWGISVTTRRQIENKMFLSDLVPYISLLVRFLPK